MAATHTTLAGALTGAGISSATVLLGAQVDALVVGLIAAVFASTWLESIDSLVKAAGAVLFAAMLAAYGSPVAAAIIAVKLPSAAIEAEALRLLFAALIGGLAPSMVPLAIRYMGKKMSGFKT